MILIHHMKLKVCVCSKFKNWAADSVCLSFLLPRRVIRMFQQRMVEGQSEHYSKDASQKLSLQAPKTKTYNSNEKWGEKT